MLGRLSPPIQNKIQAFPQKTWREEFEKASNLGFELIEWICDSDLKNPIYFENNVDEIKKLSKKHDVKINSLCADFFMENLLFNVSEFELNRNISVLKKLIKTCSLVGIQIIEIPLVDSSSLKTEEHRKEIIKNLEPVLPKFQDHGMILNLETDMNPKLFDRVLTQFNHPVIKANYDVGNSTSLGYDIKEELEILKHWIKNIHVKDKKTNGNTVPLGTGDVDFDLFFTTLKKIEYNSDLIIQGAREDLTNPKLNPEITSKNYLNFTKLYVDKYSI